MSPKRLRVQPVVVFLESRRLFSIFQVTDTGDSATDTGSLRYALLNAQNGDSIDFDIPTSDPGYNATTNTWTISPNAPLPPVSSSITIDGSSQPGYANGGAPVIVLDANNAFGVLQVDGGVTATLSGLTITGGSAGGINNAGTLTIISDTISDNDGGGILNQGTLTVTGSTISDNSAYYGAGITNSGTLTVADSTISDNTAYAAGDYVFEGGGGIANSGTVTVTGSAISDNSAYYGGGVSNQRQGTFTALDCTFDDDRATAFGGAILNGGSTSRLDLFDCSFTGNSAGTTGGAISNAGSRGQSGIGSISGCTFRDNSAGSVGGGGISVFVGALTITNSTIADNSASGPGGGIFVYLGVLKAEDDTISGNGAATGGGIANEPGSTASIGNTIVADNTATSSGPDVVGTFASQGHNLIGETDGSSGWLSSDLTGTVEQPLDPLLAALANNGGPTETMALLAGSPAIDAGSTALAFNPTTGRPLTTDQRGAEYLRIVNGAIDIGALETANPDSGNPTVLVVTNTSDDASAPGSLRYRALERPERRYDRLRHTRERSWLRRGRGFMDDHTELVATTGEAPRSLSTDTPSRRLGHRCP